jgi:hypothetical protein
MFKLDVLCASQASGAAQASRAGQIFARIVMAEWCDGRWRRRHTHFSGSV